MKNSIGTSIILTLAGESHGSDICAILDGMAPGLRVDEAFIARQLERRRPSGLTDTARREADAYRIVSGVKDGLTTGAPICILIPNTDVRSADYDALQELARPSHADWAASAKYGGFEDRRGGVHFSGRITVGIVAAGAIALSALKAKGIAVGTHILRCGGAQDRSFGDIAADIEALHRAAFPVLDEAAGLPVWFTLVPGNVLDANTIMQVVDDVKDTLDIEMNSVVLDAGYVTKDLVQQYPAGAERKMIARMPAKKGYPYKSLYEQVRDKVGNGKYTFVRNGHKYFGYRKVLTLFDTKIWAYVYVDKYNAVVNSTKWISEHPEEYERMKMKEKTWMEVSFGYFVLLSNEDKTPAGLLDDYFGRTDIESVIKTGKEYVNLLPLCKWNETTISGKILLDIIDLNIYLMLRKKMSGTKKAVTEMLGTAQSLMCHCDKNGIIKIETPNKQVKEMAKLMGAKIPAYMKLTDLEKMALGKM